MRDKVGTLHIPSLSEEAERKKKGRTVRQEVQQESEEEDGEDGEEGGEGEAGPPLSLGWNGNGANNSPPRRSQPRSRRRHLQRRRPRRALAKVLELYCGRAVLAANYKAHADADAWYMDWDKELSSRHSALSGVRPFTKAGLSSA